MRLGRLPALPVLLAVLTAVAAVPARAQTSNTDRQRQLQQQILEVGNEEAAALQTLQEIRNRKVPIDARVTQLDAQLTDASARIAPLEAEAARLTGVLQDAQGKLATTQAELEAAKDEFRDSAAGIYRSARRGATFDALRAQRPMGIVQGSKYLDRVNRDQRAMMRRITVLRDEVDAQRRTIQAGKEQADAATAHAQRLRDEIASTRAEIEPARAEAAAQALAEEAQVNALAAKKAQYEREMEAVSAAIAEELRRQQASGASPPASSGNAGSCDARPAAGPIVSGFGSRTNPIGGGTGFHAGVDIAAPMGSPIYACWSGRILSAGWQGGYGNAVVIDHGGGKATLYGHQSRMAVSPGQSVSAGTVIGYVGSTGNSTGPHLHFEVRLDGNPVDPMPYL